MARRITRAIGATALGGALALSGLVAPTTAASAYPDSPSTVAVDGTCEGELRRLHDQARASAGLPALREDPAFDQVARSWAFHQARTGTLAHNPDHVAQIGRQVPGWRRITENVGYASTADRLHTAYMGSTGHRANILDRNVQRVAIGCVRDAGGRLWSTVNFVGASTTLADRRPTPFRTAGDASARLRWWLLAKGPTAAEVESDATGLLGSWSAADLAVRLATSTTHGTVVPGTARLYGGAFDREPDASGLTYWIQKRAAGLSLSGMAARFVASAEFERRYGSLGNRAFVEQIYRNVLDREPDRSGTDYWVRKLDEGTTRGKVLVGFTDSTENKRVTATDITISWAFVQLVDRVPTADERDRWRGAFASGSDAEDIVRSLAASDAFTRRVATGGF